MTDKDDQYYQPWLRKPDPAAKPGAGDPSRATSDEGLAKPSAQPPIGIDLSRYPADEEGPRTATTPPTEKLASGVKQTWQALRKGAGAFADWTIDLGARADVPRRVEALEIPRRTGVVAKQSATLTKKAANAVGRGAARGGRGIAATSSNAWQKMALGDKAAKMAGEAGRGLGAVAGKTRAGIDSVAKAGKDSIDEAASKLRPPEPVPPPSGLEQLLEREKAEAGKPQAPDLPLFAGGGDIAPVSRPVAASPSPTAAPAPQQPRNIPTQPARAVRDPAVTAQPVSLPALNSAQWALAVFAAILLIGAVFWLGGRFGGGLSRSEVETVVAEYIEAHPEIIPAALEAQQKNEMTKAIDAIRPALERPYAGAWAGNANGDVTVVLFSDYACGYCRVSVPDVDRLLNEDKSVKVVFRELPIIAPQSRDAALMALAAARQGKYDAFHHAMFASSSLDSASIKAAADKAGVVTDGSADATANEALFQRELNSNIAIAQQLQLNATPTWIIGNQLLQGQLGYDGLRDAVAKARAAG